MQRIQYALINGKKTSGNYWSKNSFQTLNLINPTSGRSEWLNVATLKKMLFRLKEALGWRSELRHLKIHLVINPLKRALGSAAFNPLVHIDVKSTRPLRSGESRLINGAVRYCRLLSTYGIGVWWQKQWWSELYRKDFNLCLSTRETVESKWMATPAWTWAGRVEEY